MFSLIPHPPHIYVSKCMYVYVHISLFLPECARTTIIDISPRIFSLMYCCCVSIIIVICICPPGALIWLINLFLFLFHTMRHISKGETSEGCDFNQTEVFVNINFTERLHYAKSYGDYLGLGLGLWCVAPH